MSGTKTLVLSWDKSSLETFSDLRHFRPSDISSPETFFSKKWNFQSEKHAIECKWGCNHHKCAKLFLRCSAHHALASKKKDLGARNSRGWKCLRAGLVLRPEMSWSRTCLRARLVQVLRGWTCPIKKCLAARSFQKFRAGSVSWPEVSGSSIYIFARVMKVGSAVIRDERWGAHYTILCNLSKPPRILMILY